MADAFLCAVRINDGPFANADRRTFCLPDNGQFAAIKCPYHDFDGGGANFQRSGDREFRAHKAVVSAAAACFFQT
jgi:hypothetical protein